MTDYKYNRLVNDRIVSGSKKKNTVLLDDIEIKDTVIVADCYGNNEVKVIDDLKIEEFDNIFKATLLKVQKQKGSQQQTIDEYLNTKRKNLCDTLETARNSFNLKQFTKAIDLYESALKTIENDSYPDEFRLRDNDILAIKYALALCNLGLNTNGSLETANEIMSAVLTDCGLRFPTFYYLLAKVKFNMFCFGQAKQMLKIGLNILDASFKLLALQWPMSNLILIDGDKSKLELSMQELLENCANAPLPNIKCHYTKCDVDSNSIYFDSPSFFGYVSVTCSENCNTTYHRTCWKSKLKLSKDKNTKDLLNSQCETSDCCGVTKEINFFDEKLDLKSCMREQSKSSNRVGTAFLQPENEKLEDKNKSVVRQTLSRGGNKSQPEASVNLKKFATLNQYTSDRSPAQSSANQGYLFENNSSSLFINNSKLKPDVPEFLPQQNSPHIDLSPRPIILPVISQYEHNGEVHYPPPSTKHKGFQTDPIETKSIETQIEIDIKDESTQTNCNNNEKVKTFEATTQTERSEKCDVVKDDQSKEIQNGNIQDCYCKKADHLAERAAITQIVDQLNKEKKVLLNDIHELKSTIRLERSNFTVCIDKYKQELDYSKQTVLDLQKKKANLRTEYLAYQQNNNANYYKKMVLQQVEYNKKLYQVYLANMENKCKYMLWQLDEVKLLSTDNSIPSSNEIEENYQLWQKTLDETEFCIQVSQNYFENISKNIESSSFDQIEFNLPVLSTEPSNIIIHYFKTILTLNKKLEQDLSKNMLTFYKLLAVSMPNMNPYQSNCVIQESTSQEVAVRKTVPPGFSKKQITPRAATSTAEQPLHEEEPSTSTAEQPIFDDEPSTSTEVQDISDQYYIPPPLIPTTKPRLVNVNNISEDVPKSTGTIPKKQALEGKTKKMTKGSEAVPDLKSPTIDPPKPTQDIFGMDALLLTLQKYFPLSGTKTIADALCILRERQGGLTGMTNKEIAMAIKKIIKENSPKDKFDEKKCPTKTTPQAWAKINNGVEWHNSNPDRTCTICFEIMEKKHSVHLTCQHIFHTNCIKKWLQTNSICPICRSFTRLIDEFPPLM